MSKKSYISPTGKDYTEWMTSEAQIELFDKLCETEERTRNVPLKECYIDVVNALNLDAQIMGKPRRAFIQADPKLN